MNRNPSSFASRFFHLPRWQKRVLTVGADTAMLAFAVWMGFAIRLGELTPNMGMGVWLMLIAPLVSIPIFIKLGLYRAVIRYIGSQALLIVVRGAFLSTLAMAVAVLLLKLQEVPRSLFFIYFGLAFLMLGGSRYLVRYWYYVVLHKGAQGYPVGIYGAGQSGIHLANALGRKGDYVPLFFVDDNVALQGAVIQGLPVYSPQRLPKLVDELHITQLLLAMPTADRHRRKEILQQLEHLPVHVRSVPDASVLVSGKSNVDDLHEIDVDDLLGRSAVAPDASLIGSVLGGKSVMVTGAGGSIGSELCRQVLKHHPRKLVLFELSEHALYQIERELIELAGQEITLVPVLGSVQDEKRVLEVMRQHQIQLVYHAAAYKHVPLVEHNPIQGVYNNCFGTTATAKAAAAAQVERFVLISTDKAVRPTNVMGASKRLAEMALQVLAAGNTNTIFSMVRFGNVLGSSGSVAPLFRQQIQAGGPVTVTHPDIIRYFMSIPEAAQLVLQASAMAEGGEIFLLDMGEPVKIVDLAKRMIRLSGAKIKGEGDVQGIEIAYTGLRPGEKLYEELLISGASKTTRHPQILQAADGSPEQEKLQQTLNALGAACEQRDYDTVRSLLMQTVEGCQLAELSA